VCGTLAFGIEKYTMERQIRNGPDVPNGEILYLFMLKIAVIARRFLPKQSLGFI
jgi:hypothetical protein